MTSRLEENFRQKLFKIFDRLEFLYYDDPCEQKQTFSHFDFLFLFS